jgi:hypothetical protein
MADNLSMPKKLLDSLSRLHDKFFDWMLDDTHYHNESIPLLIGRWVTTCLYVFIVGNIIILLALPFIILLQIFAIAVFLIGELGKLMAWLSNR